MSAYPRLTHADVPESLLRRMKRLKAESLKQGLRVEVRWMEAKKKTQPMWASQLKLISWITDWSKRIGKGVTTDDAALWLDVSVQSAGNRLMSLVRRGVLVRDSGRPARFKVKGE